MTTLRSLLQNREVFEALQESTFEKYKAYRSKPRFAYVTEMLWTPKLEYNLVLFSLDLNLDGSI